MLFVKNIGKFLQGRKIIQDISLEIGGHNNTPEIIGVLGPNGAGKSTLFRMMVGLMRPSHGTIMLDDVDITYMPIFQRARLGMGYLPQEISVFRGLNVYQNIEVALQARENSSSSNSGREIEEVLEQFSLSHLKHLNVMSLSGGERRRVEIARCFAAKPKYVLLDEPLAGVDPIAMSEIRSLILQLKACGVSVVITDHNVREALPVIDRAYVVYNGLILAEGAGDTIACHPDVQKLYLGVSHGLH